MSALRWIAVVLTIIAIVDPSVAWPRRERPALRLVTGGNDAERRQLGMRLRDQGFALTSDGESATVATAGAALPETLPARPVFVLTDERGPDVSIVDVSASGTRVAEQAIGVSFTVRARGGAGATTTVTLEDGGLAVASASHRWGGAAETWRGTLSYLPAGTEAIRLRVRADALAGETRTDDNAVDLLGPAMRSPLRTLVVESGVTWPAAFVRRALEAAPGFTVAAIQRATPAVTTRTGTPPKALSRTDLAPYEVVVYGQPGSLDGAALDALHWFVEQRGGVLVVVLDQTPKATPRDLFAGVVFESRTLEAPVRLSGTGAGLMAAELAVPRGVPPLSAAIASDPSGAPIVFAMRRGMGAVIVSGALDAWRYRDRDDAAYARFWPAAVLQQAAAVPPPLEVTASPRLARVGDAVRVTVRLRETALAGDVDRVALPPFAVRAVNPSARSETTIRMWPSAEPGVFEGDWRPAQPADYLIDASAGAATGATIVRAAQDAAVVPTDRDAQAIVARATGGEMLDGEEALLRRLRDRFPSTIVMRPAHPARSPWYAVAFALLLCGEWALRRRRGLP